MSVSKEQITQKVEEVVTFFDNKKFIKADELLDRLDKHKVSPEQMELIYAGLNEKGIVVIDSYDDIAARDNDLLNQLEKEVSMDDPVKVYLKDIGKVALLSTEEETVLAD